LTLAEAAAKADELAAAGDEKALATLRLQWDDDLEMSARDPDFRVFHGHPRFERIARSIRGRPS